MAGCNAFESDLFHPPSHDLGFLFILLLVLIDTRLPAVGLEDV